MGTRGLVGFYKDGITKATYNHWDSYPSGVGVDILEEVRNLNVEKMKKVFDKLILIKDNQSKPSKDMIKKYEKFGDPSVDGPMTNTELKTWYQLLRNLQGTLKPYIDGEVIHIIDYSDFIKDSLFCEWAYIINLDKETLEVWEGFQEEPSNPNRYGIEKNESGYYPCKMVKEYPLNNLPDKEIFIKDLERKD